MVDAQYGEPQPRPELVHGPDNHTHRTRLPPLVGVLPYIAKALAAPLGGGISDALVKRGFSLSRVRRGVTCVCLCLAAVCFLLVSLLPAGHINILCLCLALALLQAGESGGKTQRKRAVECGHVRCREKWAFSAFLVFCGGLAFHGSYLYPGPSPRLYGRRSGLCGARVLWCTSSLLKYLCCSKWDYR